MAESRILCHKNIQTVSSIKILFSFGRKSLATFQKVGVQVYQSNGRGLFFLSKCASITYQFQLIFTMRKSIDFKVVFANTFPSSTLQISQTGCNGRQNTITMFIQIRIVKKQVLGICSFRYFLLFVALYICCFSYYIFREFILFLKLDEVKFNSFPRI